MERTNYERNIADRFKICGAPYMRGRKVDKLHSDIGYGSLRLRTERRGNQCSEERAELEGVVNGPVATSDSTKGKE